MALKTVDPARCLDAFLAKAKEDELSVGPYDLSARSPIELATA